MRTIDTICLVLSLLSIILCSVTAIFSFMAYARVVGMEKSTHQLQWMPIDSPSDESEPTTQLHDDDLGNELTKKDREYLKQFRDMYPDVEEEQV